MDWLIENSNPILPYNNLSRMRWKECVFLKKKNIYINM